MTGHASAELRRQSVNFGTVELLEKPFDVDRLKGFLTCLMPEELPNSG